MMRSLVLIAFALVLAVSDVAHAQQCGDPDGTGTVTVTDGVNALRAAAVLPSTCDPDPRLCDVDGSGAVTVTDGVNVLRAAASLPSTLDCPGIAQTIAPVVGQIQAALEIGLGFIPSQTARAAVVSECDSGIIDAQATQTIFDECRFGQLLFDGTISEGSTSVTFALRFTLLDTGDFLDLTGTLALNGENVNGTLNVASSSFGGFAIGFQAVSILLSSQGTPVSGTLRIEADLEDILVLEEIFNGNQPVIIRVTLADESVQTFTYDPVSGTITSEDTTPPARIARAEITISGQAFRFALDDLRFGNTTITFDEAGFQAPSPVNGKSVNGVTFFFSLEGAPSSDATVGGSTGPGDTPLIAPPILEGSAAGILVLQFNPPVEALRFSFATNPVEGAITSAGLRIFDVRGALLGATSQIGSVPPGFVFPEGSLGAAAGGFFATTSAARAGRSPGGAAPGW